MKREGTSELIKNICSKIEFNYPVNIDEFELMLDLGWEITFKYNDNKFEIIQYKNCIELYKVCVSATNKIEGVFLSRFSSANNFIKKAEIDRKKLFTIINDIRILHY